MARLVIFAVYFLCLSGCGPRGAASNNPATPQNNPAPPPGQPSDPTSTQPGQITPQRRKIAIVYDQSTNGIYWNNAKEFPTVENNDNEKLFRAFVEQRLKDTVAPKDPLTNPPPKNFSLALKGTINVDGFGTIFIYHWGSFDMQRGNIYKDASPLMVFDDGGKLAQGAFMGVSGDAKLAQLAIKHFLLDAPLVNKLHNEGFKIPGEEDLYDTLRKIKADIDVTLYPDLHN